MASQRVVVDASRDMMLEVDPADGTIRDANSSACRGLGWSREELLQSPAGAILPGLSEWLTASSRGDTVTPRPSTMRRRRAPAAPVDLQAFTLQDGERDSILLVLREPAAEPGAASGGEDLLEAGRELDALTYNLSHDLQAPLRAIRGFAEILREEHGDDLGQEGRRMLDLVSANAARMQLMISGLTRYGSLSKLVLRREALDMQALAESAVAKLQTGPGAAATAVRIAPLPGAIGDPDRIQDVWLQLIDNAIKFSRGVPEPAVDVGWEAENSAYFVRDNGVGFDVGRSERLYEMFQRFHSSDDFPGTGAGLAIAKRILQKHGGRIWVDSQPDRGATFRFTLPPDAD
jgi:light-regulated signal transduction histidine kinase (bacteriophytochrome)